MCPVTYLQRLIKKALEYFHQRNDSQNPTSFRCPFDVAGKKDGTIISQELGARPDERLVAIGLAFQNFHKTPKSPGIRFILPTEAWSSCDSIEKLKFAILPYQCEIMAAELEYRLLPFLPFQIQKVQKEDLRVLFEKEPFRLACAHLLSVFIKQSIGKAPESVSEITACLEKFMKSGLAKGLKNPILKISDQDDQNNQIQLMDVSLGEIIIYGERSKATQNRNCFAIVKNPFYPKEFGRYSERVEIFMTRELDFVSLSSEVRKKIRSTSNKVLMQHGIAIKDPEDDKPEGGGLWIPKYTR